MYRPYQEDEVQYLKALDFLATPVWIYDPLRWRQLFANKAALQVWKCKTLQEFLDRDYRDNSEATDKYLINLAEKFGKQLEKGEKPSSFQTQWTIYPQNIPQVLNLQVSCHVSEVKTVEPEQMIMPNRVLILIEVLSLSTDSLLINNLRSLEALRHVSTMVSIYDLSGRIVLKNRASETELILENGEPIAPEVPVDELNAIGNIEMSISPSSFLPYVTDKSLVEKIIQNLSNGDEVHSQAEVKLKKGIRIHMINGLKVLDPVTGGAMIILHEEDITTTVEQEKENLAYKLASKLKDEFLANTSHELKTPLHGIIGLADSLLDDPIIAGASEETQKSIYLIAESAKRMSDLVNDILDLARLARSDVMLSKKFVNLHSIVSEIFQLCVPIAKKQAPNPSDMIEFINDVPPDLVLEADEARLKQVLQNLVSNSVKFMDYEKKEGRNFIKVHASTIHNTTGDWVCVQVSDSGIGIPSYAQKFIFEPFISGIEEDMRKQLDVTGLGLAITKKLIELHGGNITVQSNGVRGSGTQFTFCLPYTTREVSRVVTTDPCSSKMKHHAHSHSVDSVAANLNSLDIDKPLILCVDDDLINLRILTNLLRKHGYRTKTAINGREAIDYIVQNGKPDLVLLDVMMPGMDGFQVCAFIRQHFNESVLPIILLSANSQSESMIKGNQAGANAYVSKPFDKESLLKKVHSLV